MLHLQSSLKTRMINSHFICVCVGCMCVFLFDFFFFFFNQLDCMSVLSFIKVPSDIDSIVIICENVGHNVIFFLSDLPVPPQL